MNNFSKANFESRMDERQEKIDALKEKYGKIENIPLKEKEKLVQSTIEDLPIINGLHIAGLEDDIKKLRTDIIFVEIIIALLSFALILHLVVK